MKNLSRFKVFENSQFTYKIRIDYVGGNSEGSHDEVDYIGLEWSNLKIAKENLQRIAEHTKMCKEIDENWSYRRTTLLKRKEFFDSYLQKDWFFAERMKPFSISRDTVVSDSYFLANKEDCQKIPDPHEAEYRLYLYTDDGRKIQTSAFWHGTFERIKSAEIEIDKTDLRIEF